MLFARLEVLNISGNRLTDACGSYLSTILKNCKGKVLFSAVQLMQTLVSSPVSNNVQKHMGKQTESLVSFLSHGSDIYSAQISGMQFS